MTLDYYTPEQKIAPEVLTLAGALLFAFFLLFCIYVGFKVKNK